jgi:hypothetical protein
MSRFKKAEELIRAADSVRELTKAGLDPRRTDMERVLNANRAYEEATTGEPLRR